MKRPTSHYSPIAFMVRLYHDKYHLNYVHAKKLFAFDIALILGTILLMVCTVAWRYYDPTIVDYIELNIAAYNEDGTPLARIASGEPVTYRIEFTNTSDVLMQRPQLALTLPEFFEITELHTSNIAYDAAQGIFSLPDIPPEGTGSIEIDGVYFGTPDTYEDIKIALSYIQSGRTQSEVRHARIISSLRDAVLVTALDAPNIIRDRGPYPISISLENSGSLAITDIFLSTTTPFGTITWDSSTPLFSLDANVSTTVQGTFIANIRDASVRDIALSVTPSLRRNDSTVPQDITTKNIAVVHPKVRIDSATVNQVVVQGGDTITLTLQLTNTGDSTLTDLTLNLPLNANTIDIARSRAQSTGAGVNGNELVTPIGSSLAPQQSATIEVPIVVRTIPQGGTDTTITFTPRVSATAPGSTTPLQTESRTKPIAVGTSIILSAESRYYTDEGDQLGRGPLPPTVGTETKYWALITIQNTTSRVADVTMTASLGPNISWTGRTSVSAGNDISHSAATGQIQYALPSMAPYQTVGLYMELATTPTADMRGTVPLLLENITVHGQDSFIDVPLSRTISTIDANLTNDMRGITRGTTVQ